MGRKIRPLKGQLPLFPEDSLVSHSLMPGKSAALTTTATSGRKCFESYMSSGRNGSLARTFLVSLLTAEEWSSSRCALIWKTKVTKFKRSVFQLVPSTLRIAETDGGSSGDGSGGPSSGLPSMVHTPKANYAKKGKDCGADPRNGIHSNLAQLRMSAPPLIPTPQATDSSAGSVISPDDHYYRTKGGTIRKVNRNGIDGTAGLSRTIAHIPLMVPTPAASDVEGGMENAGSTIKNGRFVRVAQNGVEYGDKLSRAIHNLPLTVATPRAMDVKGVTQRGARAPKDALPNQLAALEIGTGTGWKLHPNFVEWVMGYPEGWTDIEEID